MTIGIIFAILAALTWALGDFMIEKTTRVTSNSATLFYISLFASVAFLPFVWSDLSTVFVESNFIILICSSLFFSVASVFDFKALQQGKISVIEPICAFEVPITALLAVFILKEDLNLVQTALISFMVIGIFLVSTKNFKALRNIHAERGVWFALVATIMMGVTNFVVGQASRMTNPFMTIWFMALFVLVWVTTYLIFKGELLGVLKDAVNYKKIVGPLIVADNFSWIFYSYAVLTLPIAIALAVSESYVALAALLGVIYNKEKLSKHQYLGMFISIVSVIALSLFEK